MRQKITMKRAGLIAAVLAAAGASAGSAIAPAVAQAPAPPAVATESAGRPDPSFNMMSLRGARPGSKIKVPAGAYGPITLTNLPANLTLDFADTRLRGLRINGARGLTIIGGRFENAQGFRGLEIRDSSDIVIRGFRGVGAGVWLERVADALVEDIEVHRTRGFVAADSKNVVLRNGRFIGSSNDLLNFRSVTNFTIEDSGFIGSGYNTQDPLSSANQHPDAIQGWGTNKGVTIRRVRIACRCQGVFIKDGTVEGLVIEDVVAILDRYKWVVTAQNAVTPPVLKNVQAWSAAPGGARPGIDLRYLDRFCPPAGCEPVSPRWVDGGGNEINGRPVRPSDLMLDGGGPRRPPGKPRQNS